MNLTRRGRGVVWVAGFAFLWALVFGLESLNAVVVSAVVALGIGGLWIHRVDAPTVERFAPQPGHAGNQRLVRFQLRADGSPRATIVDQLPPGVEAVAEDNRLRRVLDGRTIGYSVIPEERGIHQLGPLEVEITDPFGLVATRYELDATTELVTYPRVYELGGLSGIRISDIGGSLRERNEFDRVREYERGDPLRDIHWRSTAKHPEDLIVKEFIARTDANRTRILAECEQGGADAMAMAAASVAITLMNDGIDVGLTVADETIAVESGQNHRARILETLASTEGGYPTDQGTAGTIRVHAGGNGDVTVTIGTNSMPFERLRRRDPARAGTTRRDQSAVAADGGWPQ